MMECHRSSVSPRQRKDRAAAASIASSSKRSWRALRPLRLNRRTRSAPAAECKRSELPSHVFVDPLPSKPLSSSLGSSPTKGTTSSSWFMKKPAIAQRAPSVETTEVTLETERSLDDHAWMENHINVKPTRSPPSPLRALSSLTLIRSASLCTVQQARALMQDKVLSSSSLPLYGAAMAGLLIPLSWIFYSLLLGLLFMLGKVYLKWASFYWNDPEVLACRRNIGQLIQRFFRELELTMQGNYARQVMASYIFWATTAPGDSLVMAILRYKMNIINMRVVEEIDRTRECFQNSRDKLHGYKNRLPK